MTGMTIELKESLIDVKSDIALKYRFAEMPAAEFGYHCEVSLEDSVVRYCKEEKKMTF